MKRKTILFRKATYKEKILPLNKKNLNNSSLYLLCNKNIIISNKQLECCRVTVSRLSRNGVKYWNNQKYKNKLNSYLFDLDENNDLYENKKVFNNLKKIMILFFRNRYYHLKKYKRKEKKKKKKKKQLNLYKKQRKQKDIFLRKINNKIDYKINNYLNISFVKRSNKSRMGKGKSKISHYMKKMNKNEILMQLTSLDKKKKQTIINQLNYKTNMNLYYM